MSDWLIYWKPTTVEAGLKHGRPAKCIWSALCLANFAKASPTGLHFVTIFHQADDDLKRQP
jgi:hypothetical protein